jgi:hypothetical protein
MRQVVQVSHHSVSRNAARSQANRRPMATASTMSFPLDNSPAIDLQIFDIFDAPSRFGESSKLLSRAAALASGSRSEKSMSTSSISPRHISPLPNPIIYDGPARPRYLSHSVLRARRTHSDLSSSAEMSQRKSVTPLPSPVMFDGPSRLRPYVHDRSSSDDSVSVGSAIHRHSTDGAGLQNMSSTTLLTLATAGAVVLTGYNALKEDSRPQAGNRQ